jgi:hypothetical protein
MGLFIVILILIITNSNININRAVEVLGNLVYYVVAVRSISQQSTFSIPLNGSDRRRGEWRYSSTTVFMAWCLID